MIKVDENDPVGELEPSFPYRDVVIKRNVDMKQFYELETEIGRGKFGTVYRCREKTSGLQLAAKFVGMGSRQDRRNVEREVDIMRTLQHPRLIQLYDAFEISNVMCVIQELIEGGELFERVIDDDFILTEKACTVFVRQICEAVEFIHSQHILHLDLKPENILCLTRTGNRIKIIDFGLARKLEPDKKLQVLFGTPEFVAPEVVNFDQIGFGTDMWSVGVICYVLLSGLSPFMGETDVETMANVTIAQYDFDDDAFDDISEDAKDFISKLLMKNREQRLSASECLQHSWLRRKPPPPRNQPSPPTRRISGGLDSAKENMREFVDRWSQQSSSPQMIELIGRKNSLGRSISAEKMKIINEDNRRNNVENNSVTLMNSTNKQEGLTARNASVDNIKNTIQQEHLPKTQENIVGLVISESILPKSEDIKSIGGVPQTIGAVEKVNKVGDMNLVGASDVKPTNLKLDIEAAKKVPSIETNAPVPKATTSPLTTENSGTSKSPSSPAVKSGTIPKTPSGNSLKFDPNPSPKIPVLGTAQQPSSPALKKDVSTDRIKDAVTSSDNGAPVGVAQKKLESVVKPCESVGKPSVINQAQAPSIPTVPQSPKVESPQSPGIKQQIPQAPSKTSATSLNPVLEKPSSGAQATLNISKISPTTPVAQSSLQVKPVLQNTPQSKPSTTVTQSTPQPKPSTQVVPSAMQSKFGNSPPSEIKPSVGLQSSVQTKPTPPSMPQPSVQAKPSLSSVPQSTIQTKPTLQSMPQSKFGNFSSTDSKSSAASDQTPSQTIHSRLSHGAAQSRFGNLSTSDLKQPLEQPTNVSPSKPSVSSTPSKPSVSSTPSKPLPSGDSIQPHPTFFLSTTEDSVDMEEPDTMETDAMPNELRNVVHEMRHISVHKPKMTSQLSEPDLTKCTLQRNVPDKKPSSRVVEPAPSHSNMLRKESVDSRMGKPTMKHVPPKIHGIVLGQNQTDNDEGKSGPKVIMHKIHVEGRSEPLIPTSKENTGKLQQKPITKSQTLSKLELNESQVKSPSICNLMAKDRFDMRRGSDISCFLHNTENMESPSLSEEIKKLSSRLFQKGEDEGLGSMPQLLGHSAFKNDPIGRFMANHGVITKRPKYRLSNLNRDVPLGSPPPSSNIFYHLSHSDSFSDPHTTHSAPQSPTESPEREMASRHSGLTRDVILSLFGNKKQGSDENDDMSATSTIDSLASYFNRANSKNISTFFNNK